MYIYKAGVVGAGTMGAQIAQVITYSGLPVVLLDADEAALTRGVDTVRAIYRSRVDKGKMTAHDVDQKLALLIPSASKEAMADVDIVIEAIFEDMEVKRRLFAELERTCPASTILATNTSSLSISGIGAATRKPDKVIGMHFFNPAHVMKLVEVIPGLATSAETVDDVTAFSESLRKIPVRVNECAGFLVNRLLMPYLNEAAYALQEGAAQANSIDEQLVVFGMPMGPFTLSDMIGIDISEKVAHILYDAFGPRMTPAEILGELVRAGRMGIKSGKGFYDNEDPANRGLDAIVQAVQKKTGRRSSGEAFDVHRIILPMVNEAAICLQEGVSGAADIDIAMMAGTGFPQDKGGPLHYADAIGIDRVLEALTAMSRRISPRYWPAPMFKRMVAAGHLGKKSGRGFFTY